MQQARGLAPDRSPAWQDLAAILAHRDLQPRAANVWAALYVRAGGPGSVNLDPTEIAALVGLKQPRSLTAANNGTPGHLDTLAGIGAIDWDGARVRYVAAPADADRPRPAPRPASDTPPLPTMADVDDPLPEPPAGPPQVATVAMPRREERADFAARFASGGEGGACSCIDQEQEKTSPSPLGWRAAKSARTSRRDSPGYGPDVRTALRAAGINDVAGTLQKAAERCIPQEELLQLIADYRATKAATSGPGAIWFAIANWEPGLPASWPSAKSPADPRENWRRAVAEASRGSEAYRIIKAGNRAGKSDAQIDAELALKGLKREDADAP